MEFVERYTYLIDRVLGEHYGLASATVDSTPRGYTNQSFFVSSPGEQFVLRRSWPNKPASQIEGEEKLLAFLAHSSIAVPTPKIVPTIAGRFNVVLDESDGTRFYHLFNRLPGNVVYIWKDTCSFAQMRSIMTILAKLHAALAEYPITNQKPPLIVIQNQIDGIRKTTK